MVPGVLKPFHAPEDVSVPNFQSQAKFPQRRIRQAVKREKVPLYRLQDGRGNEAGSTALRYEVVTVGARGSAGALHGLLTDVLAAHHKEEGVNAQNREKG